jgi:hypothetical protein
VPETAGSMGRGRGFGPESGIGVRCVTKTPGSPRRREGDVTNSHGPVTSPRPRPSAVVLCPAIGGKGRPPPPPAERVRLLARIGGQKTNAPCGLCRYTHGTLCFVPRRSRKAGDRHVFRPPPERVRSYPELFMESANALGGVCPYTHGTVCFVPGSAHNATNLPRAPHVPGDSWRPQPARAATNRPGRTSDGRKRREARASSRSLRSLRLARKQGLFADLIGQLYSPQAFLSLSVPRSS